MRYGENALAVIERVKDRLDELKAGLPEGVVLHTAYDRSGLILRAVDNLQTKLIEECAIVALVCIIFLLHVRSALVAIVTLPIGILASFLVMHFQSINANIMSLGGIAIAIGVMVDAAVVMVENAHKHIERDGGKKEHWAIILDAAKEVGPSLFYSLLIVTLSFLPVFSLQAQEGRLFKPLAFTKTWAMAAAALLSITLVPVLMGYLVRGRILPEKRNPINRFLLWVYRPVIGWVLRRKMLVGVVSLLILVVTMLPYSSWVLNRVDGNAHRVLSRFEPLFPLERIGSEFMPALYEGDLLYMPTTLPGVSVTKARELLQQTDRIIRTFPEVDQVFGKIGRAETATDPAPMSMIETTITLKREAEWRDGMTPERLIDELDAAVKFPGLTNSWTMPIKTRIDMLSTGIKTPVGIKIAGEDLEVLQRIGQQIEEVIRRQEGTLSVYAERVAGGNYLDFDIDRAAVARYGLTVGDVQDVIMSALGGMNITYTVEGRERYPINLRYGREVRDSLPAMASVLISTPTGVQIPISQVASVHLRKGPPAIKSENARLNAWVYVDIRGIDVGSYVEAARAAVATEIDLPTGYSLSWSGQYEYMQRAEQRLKLVVPITLGVIFLLLFLNFRSVTESLIIMLSLPFALVGGVWLLAVLDYDMSIAVGVGFIALAGVAAETGVIMLLYLDQAWDEIRDRRQREGGQLTREDLHGAVTAGAVDRVRPKVMTVTATMAGLLPIMWGSGTGSEVMRRIAAPMVGGLVSSTLLTLLVIPMIYSVWQGWVHRHQFNELHQNSPQRKDDDQ